MLNIDGGGEGLDPRTVNEDCPQVTVVCITYAHEKFIAQALDSFVSQETTFRYQILVGEDCGPDETASIVLDYARRYPGLIVPFIRERNMGAQRNLIDLCERAGTPYIAFCEGDDYWTDPLKLQKQFDYMECHPEIRGCFHNAEIIDQTEDGNWFLANQFSGTSRERMLWPGGEKGWKNKESYSVSEYIDNGFVHTSSMFFRWDYELEIPEWYYSHQIGDFTLWILQMRDSDFGFLPDVMSAYRRHVGGEYYYDDMKDYFLDTRGDWCDLLIDLRGFFLDGFNGLYEQELNKRLGRELYNLLASSLGVRSNQEIVGIIERYGDDAVGMLAWLVNDRNKRITPGSLGTGINSLRKKKKTWKLINRVGLFVRSFDLAKQAIRRKRKILGYWLGGLIPTEKNLWVFSSFKGNTYCDNTKYLYEYVCQSRPDIKAVWITKNLTIQHQLEERGLPVLNANAIWGKKQARTARKVMRRAEVAVVDHFVMSDFGRPRPLNPKTKVVQLWHGVGLKSMDNLGLTTVKGVEYTDCLYPQSSDGMLERARKARRRITAVPKSELCERYFLMVAPGKEMEEVYHRGFHLPNSKFFHAGYPRMDALLSNSGERVRDKLAPRILYAPTYRWSARSERKLLEDLLDSLETINVMLTPLGGQLVVRLHPHTWRNYSKRIERAIAGFDCVFLDEDADVYEKLADYDVLVTDYSSIAYDFILLDRPCVFHCPDLESYLDNENALSYSFEEFTPGPKTRNWEESMAEVECYLKNPDKDMDSRKRVRDFFYDPIALESGSCERIVSEIVKRLGAEGEHAEY